MSGRGVCRWTRWLSRLFGGQAGESVLSRFGGRDVEPELVPLEYVEVGGMIEWMR